MNTEQAQSQAFLVDQLAQWGHIPPIQGWMHMGEHPLDARTRVHTFFHPLLGTHAVEATPDTFVLHWTPAWAPASVPAIPSEQRQQARALVQRAAEAATPAELAALMGSPAYRACGALLGHAFQVRVCPDDRWSPTDLQPPAAGRRLRFDLALDEHWESTQDLTPLLAPILPAWLDLQDDGTWQVTPQAPDHLPQALAELRALGVVHDARIVLPRGAAVAPRPSPPVVAPTVAPLTPHEVAGLIDANDAAGLQTALEAGRLNYQAPLPEQFWDDDTFELQEHARPTWLTYAYAQDKPACFQVLLTVIDPSQDPVFLPTLLSQAALYADVAEDFWTPALATPTLTFHPTLGEGRLSPSLWVGVWGLPSTPGCPKATLVQQLQEAILRVGGPDALRLSWDHAMPLLPGMDARQHYLAFCQDDPRQAILTQLDQGGYEVALLLMRRYPQPWKDLTVAGLPAAEFMLQRRADAETQLQLVRDGAHPRAFRPHFQEQVRLINQVVNVLQSAPTARPRPRRP